MYASQPIFFFARGQLFFVVGKLGSCRFQFRKNLIWLCNAQLDHLENWLDTRVSLRCFFILENCFSVWKIGGDPSLFGN